MLLTTYNRVSGTCSDTCAPNLGLTEDCLGVRGVVDLGEGTRSEELGALYRGSAEGVFDLDMISWPRHETEVSRRQDHFSRNAADTKRYLAPATVPSLYRTTGHYSIQGAEEDLS